jgi:hypothetical protein
MNRYRKFVGNPLGKRLLGKPGRKWNDNINTDLKKVRYEYERQMVLNQDRVPLSDYVLAMLSLWFLLS